MQSIFRLPWCTDTLVPENTKDVSAFHKIKPAPSVDIPLLNKLKRKRSEDNVNTAHFEHLNKKVRPGDNSVHLAPAAQTLSLTGNNSTRQAQGHAPAKQHSQTRDASDTQAAVFADTSLSPRADDGFPLAASPLIASTMTPLQQSIEHQFNLEILIKHRELRLIEQELAKCQVALEQLRRCEIIPFPNNDLSEQVTTGDGPSLRAAHGHPQPSAPAPWGVTDGPYSKHYSSWLLPDSTFDSTSLQAAAAIEHNNLLSRPSRNSTSSFSKPAKIRTNRESFSAAVATPVAPTPIRNKNGPLVLKRMSDNQHVKLVCTKCHRSDFSSVQGFLNHCRIAHKIDYKSHEAAAQDCGHVLQEHEASLVATAPPPVGSIVKTPAPKPAPPAPVASTVHSLAHHNLPRITWKRQRLAYLDTLKASFDTTVTAPPATLQDTAAPLVMSASTPHLSGILHKRGIGMDLASIVARLAQQVPMEADDDDDVDNSQSSIATPRRFSAVASADRPSSKKGYGQRPRPAPLSAPLHRNIMSTEVPESPQDHELSPNTADGNPGLVSDHDDDSETEEARSVIGAPSSSIHIQQGCGIDSMDIDDVQVQDDHDGILVRSRGSRQDDPQIAGSPSGPRPKFGRGGRK